MRAVSHPARKGEVTLTAAVAVGRERERLANTDVFVAIATSSASVAVEVRAELCVTKRSSGSSNGAVSDRRSA